MLQREDFTGSWQLSRRITDNFADQRGSLAGQADLRVAGAAGLTYDEEGLFQFGQASPIKATRRYHWTFGAGLVTVTFADGAPFHDFRPDGFTYGTEHLCAADLYTVRYDFRAWPKWMVRWDVKGPKKDYIMMTHYSRA